MIIAKNTIIISSIYNFYVKMLFISGQVLSGMAPIQHF